MKPENTSESSFAANSKSSSKNAGASSSSQKNISNELFSSRLIQQSPLSEEVFTNKKPSDSTVANQDSTAKHSTWQRTRWMRMLFYAGVAVLAFLLLLGGWLFFNSRQGSKSTGQFAVTSADLAALNSNKITSPSGLVIVNGNTEIAGSITANTFNGSGADLTNLNADNITSGTLNDARLSANVALLDKNQTFTGNNLFTGAVTLPSSLTLGTQLYNFPTTQAAGSLVNDGNGNLVWNPAGGCVTCFTNGGNSFGSIATIGTNDPFNLTFRSGGADRLTISTAGSSTFSGSVAAASFSGDGSGLTNLNASQIASGTLSNARLSGSVTVQGNTFNGIDQLVQLNALGYLPALNGGNLTSLNASNVTSGTLLDSRLSTNVVLLDHNQTFSGNNIFTQPLTVNTLTPSAAMTIGATNQNLTLQGTNSTSWTATQGGGTTTVNFTGVATGAVTYQFDAAATPGTYTICTTAGGACGGGGSGTVSSPGGTANKLAKFTAAQTIADSTITDTGAAVSISAPELRVNGAAGGYAIDATGDINAGTHLRVGGNIVCDSTGCNASGGGGFYIQNTTSQQSAANFFIQSASTILPTGTIKALGGQGSDLLQFQSSAGSTIAEVYTGGGFNTTDKYYVNGVQISSSNLSDSTNLAKLNANQSFTGTNTFNNTVLVQNNADSANEFKVVNAAGTTTLFNIDSLTNKVAIGQATPSWPLDVAGDINSSTGLRINGVLVCDSSGCTSTSSGGINNGTTTQANANYNIQSADINAVVGVLKGKVGQVSDLFQAQNDASTPVFKIGQAGLTTINNGITLTGGNQTIQNNTGALNLTASSTTISLNNTTTITSGDGTGLRYAADYAYQPLSLVSRQYVDNAISSVVIGACPTCFLKGGNSFGTSASLGTIDNYVLTLKTANTTRMTLGTDGSVAFAGSTASNSYAISYGSGTASGYISFAGGELTTAASQDSFAIGYQSQVTAGLAAVALGRQTTASNNYAMATGYLSTASGTAAFATGRGTASGDYSFVTGGGTATAQDSFAGGYNISPITASGLGSFAFGRTGFAITAAGAGSVAFGYTDVGANTANGNGSLVGGTNSTTGAGASYAISFGDGTQANGAYSAAFNNSIASGTGAIAVNNGTASGVLSFAGGEGGTQAYGRSSFAYGYNVKANDINGNYSIAFGRDSTANHNYSFAAGYGARASGGEANVAFNYALASGSGAFAIGSSLVESSGTHSFAGGYAQTAITSSSNGSFAFGRSGGFTITAAGEGSVAFGYTNTGANIANGSGSLVGGSNTSTSVGGTHAIAWGDGAQANGAYSAAFNSSIASGIGAFSVGGGTASGTLSFAGGYNSYPITASNNGSFAFGRAANYTISSTAEGAFAVGFSRDGVILASGAGSFAGGNSSTASNEFAIAYGSGTQATGAYSAAFNNSIASNSGAFAINSGIASGALSFAGGEGGTQAYARRSFAYGYNVKANNLTGEGSIAFGRDTTANNNYSFAAGYGAVSSGEASVALNYSSASGLGATSVGSQLVSSSGAYSFAGGYANVAISATNNGAFAFGRSAGFTISATGEGSFAIGVSRDGAILANGYGAFAGGTNSTASGEFAIAYGSGTQATGNYSAAFNNSISSNFGSFAINNGTASGILSFAGGEGGTQAYARRSFAFGTNVKANDLSGEGSIAFGKDTTANNNYSFALGNGATASGLAAFAINAANAGGDYSFAGYTSTTSNYGAFAFGDTNTASGPLSTTFGSLNTASGTYSTAFGRRMNVSGNYSFGVSLNDTAISVTDANSFVINAGYVGINTASPSSYSSAFSLVGTGYTYGSTTVSTGIASRVRAGDNSSGTLIQFERADATVVGSITHNGSNTAYNTSSDARLKHDITDTNLSLDTVLQLKVHDFIYNNDASNTVTTGFIAQELQKLYPEAVSVMDTKTGYLGVDYGKLTPLLAKGIQDLNTKVDNLQTEVDTLKAKQSATTTSVDVVAELAKASAITINGNLTVNGKVVVVGNLELKGDNTGTVKVPAGQTRVHLSFTKAFTNTPNVTATPKSLTKASFAIENESVSGFDIVIDQAQTTDTDFNYHAL